MAFAPREVHSFSTPNDPHDILPPAAQKKWIALVQRATDAHNAVPEFEIRQEAAETVTGIQNRIAELTRARAENGYGLSDEAASVIVERKKLERATAERDRLQALYEVRSARWNACMRLRSAVKRLADARRHPAWMRDREHRGPAVVGVADEERRRPN